METESNALPESKSNRWIWIILAIAGLCAMVTCCFLISAAGVSVLLSYRGDHAAAPRPRITPTPKTNLPTLPKTTMTPFIQALPGLDYEADPLFGSADLQWGFSPDPYSADVLAGGSVDTSDFELNCGFVSPAPSFAFRLSGEASVEFLRIFFESLGDADTTLVIHTPDQGWLCVDDSTYGSGKAPVIDFESAASGNYAVWVGLWGSKSYGIGSLYITQSADTTP